MKPGYRTSEFWFTMVSFIFSALFLLGIIKENDTKEELISIVAHGVESVILIGGQVLIFYRYIKSRDKKRIQDSEEYHSISRELEEYVGVDKNLDKININEATIAELIQLPHIGPQVAKRIVEFRQEHGNFSDTEDLVLVKGIGENVYSSIEKYLTL